MSINQRARKRFASSIDLDSLLDEKARPPPSPSKASFRPPAKPLARLSTDDFSLKPRESISKSKVRGVPNQFRLKERTRRHTTVIGSEITLSQNEHLPADAPIPDLEAEEVLCAAEDQNAERDYEALADHFDPGIPLDNTAHGRDRYYRKKFNQWQRWNNETIPYLIPIYHGLLKSTNQWRDFPAMYQPSSTSLCESCPPRLSKLLKVSCIQWQETYEILIPICACVKAAEILLKHGFFPCAPLQPSLAVDIRMLEFIRELFLRIAPNYTAWCDALETVLGYRGFSLPGKSTFRKRFSNALSWFGHFWDRSNQCLEEIIDKERPYIHNSNHRTMVDALTEEHPDSCNANRHEPEPVHMQDNQSLRASHYLRARCALCFGGNLPGSELPIPDIVAQIDACFGQCRRDIGKDPPVKHPHCHFLSESTIDAMRAEVETRRPPNKVGPDKRKRPTPAVVEDRVEATGLPTSVLDACERTFEAADERRQKASTRFFKDTGLMALLCRHDRVLFVANMQTAGEKQFYVFALIKTLFEHLPANATVGLLYDVGCAIHRSIVKWNFLADYQHRLVFGLSIFHAYGHEWPCQLRYAPRLREGFGLSNGEGCERFWSSIKGLIPNLRISGHHRRVYTLNMQIDFLDFKASQTFGSWIAKQLNRAENMIAVSTLALDESKKSEQFLQEQWKDQLTAQIKPLPAQNKNRGKTAVEATLAARERLRASEEEVQKIKDEEERIVQLDPGSDILDELEIKLLEATRQRDLKKQLVARLEQSLGVEEKQELRRLKDNRYLQLRMNARALKQRVRDRLRQRKFELARVERSYRHSVNERKLVDHAENIINKRIGTITETAQAYNTRCKEIAEMIAKKQAPRWACAPQPLDLKNLFTLDVDHEIWQDVGLEDGTDGPPPAWLADVQTRSGIRALLNRDRAHEERNRVEHELRNLQTWVCEELGVLDRVLEQYKDSEGIVYCIKQRQSDILDLQAVWSIDTQFIPVGTWVNQTRGACFSDLHIEEPPTQHHPASEQARDDLGDYDEDDEIESTEGTDFEFMEDEGLVEAIEIVESGQSIGMERLQAANEDKDLEDDHVTKRLRSI